MYINHKPLLNFVTVVSQVCAAFQENLNFFHSEGINQKIFNFIFKSTSHYYHSDENSICTVGMSVGGNFFRPRSKHEMVGHEVWNG